MHRCVYIHLSASHKVLMKFVAENRPSALEAVSTKLVDVYMAMPLAPLCDSYGCCMSHMTSSIRYNMYIYKLH